MSSDLPKRTGLRIIRSFIKICSFVFGATLAGVAIWAYQLGIDNNPTFGPKRVGMLLVGMVLIVWAAWDWIGPKLGSAINSAWQAFNRVSFVHTPRSKLRFGPGKVRGPSGSVETPRLLARYRQTALIRWIGRHWLGLSLGFTGVLAFAAYLWIISAGKMIFPTSGTQYFTWLAEAFKAGQTHLLIKPSPGILSLPNPYDYRLRREVNHIWDATLYDGKYYLYWGPVPGIIVLFLQWLSFSSVRDSLLTLFFVCGSFVFAGMFLFAIWHHFENKFPGWVYLGGLLAVALNVPMVWLLTRPAVYEASIAGGQCFLMAGLYWSFIAVRSSDSNKVFLTLAGVSWALTAGTRVNLVPAIIFLSFMVIWRVFQIGRRKVRSVFVPVLTFLLPLIVGAVLLAGYNYVRFGSIFELGHRYQLTGPGGPANYDRVSDLDYFLPNLYNYLGRLPEFKGEFPFITIPWEKTWPFFIRLPQDYYTSEPAAGILWVVPVTGFALLVFIRYLWLTINQSLPGRSSCFSDSDHSLLTWLNISLAGSGGLQLVLLLVFVASSHRYIADATLIAILLATVFIAQICAGFQRNQFQQRGLATFWLISSGLTAILAIIVNISGFAHGFERNNPELFQYLYNLFS